MRRQKIVSLLLQVHDIKFQAPTLEEKESWIKALNEGINRGKNKVFDEVRGTVFKRLYFCVSSHPLLFQLKAELARAPVFHVLPACQAWSRERESLFAVGMQGSPGRIPAGRELLATSVPSPRRQNVWRAVCTILRPAAFPFLLPGVRCRGSGLNRWCARGMVCAAKS